MLQCEIISIDNTDLSDHWVIVYKTDHGSICKEPIIAHDPHEALIKFRNQMIRQGKSSNKIYRFK